MEISVDLLRWLWAAVLVPAFGAVGWVLRGWWRKRQLQQQRLAFLRGMHPNQKALLAEFAMRQTHTLEVDPFSADVQQLVRFGVLRLGEPVGPYAALSRYATLEQHFFELLQVWVARDPVAGRVFAEAFQALDKTTE